MNTYQVTWSSQGNIEHGTVIVRATGIVQAQDKFWSWLRQRPVYQHMWRLEFEIREVEEAEVIE